MISTVPNKFCEWNIKKKELSLIVETSVDIRMRDGANGSIDMEIPSKVRSGNGAGLPNVHGSTVAGNNKANI